MPLERRANSPALHLPPGFNLVTLREVGDAFAHAKAHAAELGAGTLIYVGRFDLAEFAVVLEPDEPLRTARRVFYAGLAALGEALAAHAPPEKPIHFIWPDTIEIDGGVVGGGQLGWPDTPEDEPPPWLVFGGMIRTVSMAEGDPGLRPLSTAIEEEGFDEAAVDLDRVGPVEDDRPFWRRMHCQRVGERGRAGIDRAPRLPERLVGLQHHRELGQVEAADMDERAGALLGRDPGRVRHGVADLA
jgi:hypothetical protein